ncbi:MULTISPECIES: zinc ribbon domain-containing protein [Jonquetella]|uniref:Zinc ribbon domain-containing protein n=1 Tax=Jonquetella anthropi DSM 22815 TaxID=885272 RepID=H0UM13_9BACT|nr:MULTISPECIES: zinc ribbon domain-containing protein [Jonquetella]EEX47574.1 hypothetical protein GCWU000246_01708 [Jonquetella anthropi E3_33 E1]EHM12555.1 hypothetical protein JonanDRAFT_0124 [Jonquetella anthropi DSM 22815]
MALHVFRCVLCGHRFESDRAGVKCPKCGSRTLVHESGDSLRGKCGCGGSCCSCSGCSH